jgi:hypothetical protein
MRVSLDSSKLTHAIQVRGLHLSDVARITGLTLPTISAAVSGRQVNVATALAVTRAVISRPVITELEALIECPDVASLGENARPPASRPSGSGRSG